MPLRLFCALAVEETTRVRLPEAARGPLLGAAVVERAPTADRHRRVERILAQVGVPWVP